DQVKLQIEVPSAVRHVAPLSTETSTAATTPPTSLAVPVIVTGLPLWACAPIVGDVITEIGAITSLDGIVAIRGRFGSAPVCSVAGAAPMSASRVIVACWIA